jgi:hypothetical protein
VDDLDSVDLLQVREELFVLDAHELVPEKAPLEVEAGHAAEGDGCSGAWEVVYQAAGLELLPLAPHFVELHFHLSLQIPMKLILLSDPFGMILQNLLIRLNLVIHVSEIRIWVDVGLSQSLPQLFFVCNIQIELLEVIALNMPFKNKQPSFLVVIVVADVVQDVARVECLHFEFVD